MTWRGPFPASVLLVLTLQLLCPWPSTAASLAPHNGSVRAVTGVQDRAAFPRDVNGSEEQERGKHLQVRSLPMTHPNMDTDNQVDPFRDMDAKALATILLQALKIDEEKTGEREGEREAGSLSLSNPSMWREADKDSLVENVKSQTRSRESAPQRQVMAWAPEREDGGEVSPQSIEQMEAMLQELEKYSTATKRERSNTALRSAKTSRPISKQPEDSSMLGNMDDIEELVGGMEKDTDYNEEHEVMQEPAKRADKSVSRFQAGSLSRLGAGEPGPDKAEEEQIADITSDLLLQYLLKGGDMAEQEDSAKEKLTDGERKRSDEEWEEDVAEEKRSDEEGGDDDDDDGGDMDPQTIDRLIEISSKLHLPADDVIDIINDVEKKRKNSVEKMEPTRHHHTTPRDRIKPAPGRSDQRQKVYLPTRHRPEKPRHWSTSDMALQDLLGADNELDYGAMPLVYPRRFHLQQNLYPNYIRPRVYQPRHSTYRYQPSPSLLQNEDYYDDDQAQDKEEELENYIEKILLQHPEVFQ
uniref:Neurosecretory protein VGF n=1 Tax=Callorhinchus milii TaxID=7868 RepID=V9KR13_CALMI